MSTTITHPRDLPPSPFYVSAVDSFMSGWGQAADRPNLVVLPCRSLTEAETVADNARARSEMRRIRIRCSVGHSTFRRYLVSLMHREDAGRWYEPGGFSRA